MKCRDALVGPRLAALIPLACSVAGVGVSVDYLALQRVSGDSEGTDPQEGKLDVLEKVA